jgi:hypothetical protein
MYFEEIKTLYKFSILSVEELSILFSVIKTDSKSQTLIPALREKVVEVSRYDSPEGLVANLNQVVFKDNRNAYMAFRLNYRLRKINPTRKKWVALYFCLVLYFSQ